MSEAEQEIQRGEEILLEIEDLSSEGAGIGRAGRRVFFVPGTVPGDKARVKVERIRKSWVEARLLALAEASPDRVAPVCTYQGACGGCPLMILDYEAALEAKRRQLEQVLRRIGHMEIPVQRVLASPQQTEYRNRVRLVVSPRGQDLQLGFRPKGQSRGFVPIQRCWLIHAEALRLGRVLMSALSVGLVPEAAWPTHLSMRVSGNGSQWLAVLHTPQGSFRGARSTLRRILEEEPALIGVVRIVERGPRVLAETQLAGDDKLVSSVHGVEVADGATTFLQVNLGAAELLYQEIESALVGETTPARLLDLYCGMGLSSLATTDDEVRILGVDANPASIERARAAASRAGRLNAEFVRGDAGAQLKELAARGARFDRIVMNPPRSGMGAGAVEQVRCLGAQRLVMVSCHPAAMARDLAAFVSGGFRVTRVHAVDMFPQTPHLEAVAQLQPASDGPDS